MPLYINIGKFLQQTLNNVFNNSSKLITKILMFMETYWLSFLKRFFIFKRLVILNNIFFLLLTEWTYVLIPYMIHWTIYVNIIQINILPEYSLEDLWILKTGYAIFSLKIKNTLRLCFFMSSCCNIFRFLLCIFAIALIELVIFQ